MRGMNREIDTNPRRHRQKHPSETGKQRHENGPPRTDAGVDRRKCHPSGLQPLREGPRGWHSHERARTKLADTARVRAALPAFRRRRDPGPAPPASSWIWMSPEALAGQLEGLVEWGLHSSIAERARGGHSVRPSSAGLSGPTQGVPQIISREPHRAQREARSPADGADTDGSATGRPSRARNRGTNVRRGQEPTVISGRSRSEALDGRGPAARKCGMIQTARRDPKHGDQEQPSRGDRAGSWHVLPELGSSTATLRT